MKVSQKYLKKHLQKLNKANLKPLHSAVYHCRKLRRNLTELEERITTITHAVNLIPVAVNEGESSRSTECPHHMSDSESDDASETDNYATAPLSPEYGAIEIAYEEAPPCPPALKSDGDIVVISDEETNSDQPGGSGQSSDHALDEVLGQGPAWTPSECPLSEGTMRSIRRLTETGGTSSTAPINTSDQSQDYESDEV